MELNLRNLNKLEQNISELPENESIPLNELMNPNFISNCSQFSDLEELMRASGFKVASKEDFEAIPEQEWEKFIQENTSYESWTEMQQSAGVNYVKSKLFKDLT